MSQQINLLNPIFRKKPSYLTPAAGIAAGVGAAAVLTAVYGIYEETQLTRVEAQARAVAKSLGDLRAQYDPQAGAPRKPDAALENKVVALTADLMARQQVLEALKGGTVGATAGFSEYMRAFSRQRLEGVWLTGFDIAAGGAELTIAGRALAADMVPTYLQRLNKESPMQGRQFASVLINRPASQPAKEAKDAEPRPALPPYLDFVISSGEPQEAGKTASKGPPLALRSQIDAELRGKKAEWPQ